MIKSLLEDTDFLPVKEKRNHAQKMMQPVEELNTDCSCDSKVERYNSGSGEISAHDDVLAKKSSCQTSDDDGRARGAKADETVALGLLAQQTTQELHNERERNNSDEVVAVGAAAHAANNLRAKRRLSAQRERAKRILISSMLDATFFLVSRLNTDYFRKAALRQQHRHAQCT